MKINLDNQEDIIEHYGVQNQLCVHMEECAELIQAISKCQRAFYNRGIAWEMAHEVEHLTEEIADVIVCIDQLKFIFNISDEAVENMAQYKISRQKRRVTNEN